MCGVRMATPHTTGLLCAGRRLDAVCSRQAPVSRLLRCPAPVRTCSIFPPPCETPACRGRARLASACPGGAPQLVPEVGLGSDEYSEFEIGVVGRLVAATGYRRARNGAT